MKTDIKRRAFLGSAILASTALAACSSLTAIANETVPVTLAGAQAEATAIYAALKQIASGLVLTTSETNILSDFGKAAAAFAGITPGETYLAAADQVIADVTPALAVVGVSGATLIDINAGIALIEGLVNGLTAVPVPAVPATPAVGAKPVVVIGATAPIPIAVPVS